MKISVRPSLIRNILRNDVCKKWLLRISFAKNKSLTSLNAEKSSRNDTCLKIHFKKQPKLHITSNKQETLAYTVNSSHS